MYRPEPYRYLNYFKLSCISEQELEILNDVKLFFISKPSMGADMPQCIL
jgi:hypothetical protein